MYNFHPDRDIAGYKTFYNQEKRHLIVGEIMHRRPALGERVILHQDEQSDYGKVIDLSDLTIDAEGDYVSITDDEAVIYKSIADVHIAVPVGFMLFATLHNPIKRLTRKRNML